MKKLVPVLVLVLIVALFCSACGTAKDAQEEASVAETAAVTDTSTGEDTAANITGNFVGHLKDQIDQNNIRARIDSTGDGSYMMDLGIDQVDTISDIRVFSDNGRLHFSGTDPNGEPILGYLKVQDNQVVVVFDNAKWDIFSDGTEVYMNKTS